MPPNMQNTLLQSLEITSNLSIGKMQGLFSIRTDGRSDQAVRRNHILPNLFCKNYVCPAMSSVTTTNFAKFPHFPPITKNIPKKKKSNKIMYLSIKQSNFILIFLLYKKKNLLFLSEEFIIFFDPLSEMKQELENV